MKKYSVFLLLVFFAVVAGIHFSEPVSASSWVKFDKKVVYTYTGQHGYVKLVYTVYKKNKNNVWLKQAFYSKPYKSGTYKHYGTHNWYLKKVSKTKLRIVIPDIEGNYSNRYVKTKYSAVNYYLKVYKKSKHMKEFPST